MFVGYLYATSVRLCLLWITLMTWVLDSSGTQTAVINTEHTLATSTTNATFQSFVRLNNLALGDTLELRIYNITLSGGTLEVCWKATYGPALPVAIVSASPPLASDQSYRLTLKQTAGTGRNFDWKILRI
jgi:hypothetical protein